MLKNASIGRERAKRERDERKAQKEAMEREEEQKRQEDFDGWLEGIRQQREVKLIFHDGYLNSYMR